MPGVSSACSDPKDLSALASTAALIRWPLRSPWNPYSRGAQRSYGNDRLGSIASIPICLRYVRLAGNLGNVSFGVDGVRVGVIQARQPWFRP